MNFAYCPICIIFLLIIPFILFSQPEEIEKKNIAVIDLDSEGGLSKSEVSALTNRLRSQLVNTNAFDVVNRGRMQNILAEQGFQMVGCTSTDCAVEAGKILGVQEMVTGTIGKIGSLYTIDIILIEVESSKILTSLTRDYKGAIEGLVREMGYIAEELAKLERGYATVGSLNLSSEPNGATIFIDQIESGVTPKKITNLATGDHEILLQKDGYADYSTTIKIVKDEAETLTGKLVKKYVLSINANVGAATVFINNRQVGKTPFKVQANEGTKWKIALKKENYKLWQNEVTMNKNVSLIAEMLYTDAFAASMRKNQEPAELITTGKLEESTPVAIYILGGAVIVGFIVLYSVGGVGG